MPTNFTVTDQVTKTETVEVDGVVVGTIRPISQAAKQRRTAGARVSYYQGQRRIGWAARKPSGDRGKFTSRKAAVNWLLGN